MSTPTLEVTGRPDHPFGMTPQRFLRDHWQKRPLLVRQALPGFQTPISPNELAGLACEPLALSRLIRHTPRSGRWQVESGPFAEDRFQRLPSSHWTLLVQDVDKWDPAVAQLLRLVDFLPAWRQDDIMISYAVKGGSVGAHLDQYDVFLLQGLGRRRWQIDTRATAPRAFRDDVELKLLAQFEPDQDWVLEPGDLLYLPPNLPHHGVALDECMTLSLGMRAPSATELILDLAESVAAALPEDQRYADPDLAPRRDRHAIEACDLARVRQAISALRGLDDQAIAEWFANFASRYRLAQTPAAPPRALSRERIDQRLQRGARLLRQPFSALTSIAWRRGRKVFLAGEEFTVSTRLYTALTRTDGIDAPAWQALTTTDQAVLTRMVNAGHFGIGR
ncbi:MAG: cupin domain-containing protein [Lysobacterales bacterium]